MPSAQAQATQCASVTPESGMSIGSRPGTDRGGACTCGASRPPGQSQSARIKPRYHIERPDGPALGCEVRALVAAGLAQDAQVLRIARVFAVGSACAVFADAHARATTPAPIPRMPRSRQSARNLGSPLIRHVGALSRLFPAPRQRTTPEV